MPTRYAYGMPAAFAGAGFVNCDGFEVNDGVENSLRQPVAIGDPTSWAAAAAVANAALAGTEYGMAVRSIESAPNSAATAAQVTVGTSSVQISAGSPAPNRRKIKVKNVGPDVVWVGFSNPATAGSGYRLEVGESDNFDLGPAFNVYAIGRAAGNTVCIAEFG